MNSEQSSKAGDRGQEAEEFFINHLGSLYLFIYLVQQILLTAELVSSESSI